MIVCVLSRFSRVQLFVTLSTAASQAPLSMGFSRQEHWSGLPSLPPGNLPNPGIEPASLMSAILAGRFLITSATWEAHITDQGIKLWEGFGRAWKLGERLWHSLCKQEKAVTDAVIQMWSTEALRVKGRNTFEAFSKEKKVKVWYMFEYGK